MYDWVYLCCNRWMLDLFLQLLPDEMPGLRHIHVVLNADVDVQGVDDRVQFHWWDDTRVLHHKMAYYNLRVKLQCFDVSDIDVLYTDDDVVCLKDPSYLGNAWCTGSHLDQLGFSDRDELLCQMLTDVSGKTYDQWSLRTDAGIWYLKQEDKAFIKQATHDFFDHVHYDMVFDRKSGNYFRTIDQRVLSACFNKLQYNAVTTTEHIKVIYSMKSTIVKKRTPTFYHYGCSSHKPEAAALIRNTYVASA